MIIDLHQKFTEIYQKEPLNTFFAPGRVNLIGEHIDYNGGLVMPCAINFGTYLYTAPNNEGLLRFRSLNFAEEADITLQDGYVKNSDFWFNYPLGVANHFLKDGHQLQGLDMLFYGDIPIGSGLSSSASIEVATAYAFNELLNAGYSKLDLVKLCKSVENKFIGVNSGIMDQFAVAFGEKSKALVLNCDTLDFKAVTANIGDYALAIINTNKPRKLAESKYNERVEECAAALKALRQQLDIDDLCDIEPDVFEQYAHLITNEVVYRRAKHVIEENARVKKAADALAKNETSAFGRLMYASHTSLQELYEVSGIELDTIVAYAKTNADVAGARMTGAGFGGCAIALVKNEAFDTFSTELTEFYNNLIGYAPTVYRCSIEDGVRELS